MSYKSRDGMLNADPIKNIYIAFIGCNKTTAHLIAISHIAASAVLIYKDKMLFTKFELNTLKKFGIPSSCYVNLEIKSASQPATQKWALVSADGYFNP